MQMDNNDFLRKLNAWADECHTDFPEATAKGDCGEIHPRQ